MYHFNSDAIKLSPAYWIEEVMTFKILNYDRTPHLYMQVKKKRVLHRLWVIHVSYDLCRCDNSVH